MNKIPFLYLSDLFSLTIILEPFLIAWGINLFPSNLLPLIAKKMSFFFTLELSKEIPEKNILPNSFFTFGIKSLSCIA